MSGETEKDVSGLTTDTLRLLLDSEVRRLDGKIDAAVERLDGQHQAQVHAVHLVRDSDHQALSELKETVKDRFTTVNEFRQALADLGGSMATRRETEQRFEAQATQIAELRSRLDVGPSGLTQLQLAQAQQTGVATGRETSQAGLYSLIAAVGGVLVIVVILANAWPR